MVVYYTSEDMKVIRNCYSIKPSITTSKITRYLLVQQKMLERKKNMLGDHIVLNVEFYFPVTDIEFIVGGLAYHGTSTSSNMLGPTWFQRLKVNHVESFTYTYLIDDPIIIQLLRDKTNVGFFAFPYSKHNKDEFLFSIELSQKII